MTGAILSDAQLDEHYAPIFERIAEGSIEREQKRELAYDAVKWLKESGFTALRVPRAYGGGGITLPQFFRQLSRLGAADSNLPQSLRSHFGFIEYRLEDTDEALRRRWLERVVNGDTFGSAHSERTGSTHNSVTLTHDAARNVLRLNGEKYYSRRLPLCGCVRTSGCAVHGSSGVMSGVRYSGKPLASGNWRRRNGL